MNTQPQWQYYIIDNDNGEYLSWDGSALVSSVSPTPLTYSPDGWQDLAIAWERNWERFGIGRNTTVPFGFFRDGANILRSELLNNSVNRSLSLLIKRHKLDYSPSTFQHKYNFFYQGEFDLTTYKDNGEMFTVQVKELGIHKKLNSKWNAVQELPMDSNIVWLKHDGLFLTEKHNWLIPQSAYFPGPKVTIGGYHISSEGMAAGFVGLDETNKNSWDNFTTSDNYLFKTTQAITDLRAIGQIIVSGTWGYSAFLKSSLGQSILLASQPANDTATVYTFTIDEPFSASANEKFFLVTSNVSGPLLQHYESTFSIEFKSKFKTTYIACKKSSVVAKELTEKTTGSQADIDTTFIETLDNLLLSPGDCVRGIVDNVKLKTNFQNYFEYQKVINACGLTVQNNQIFIEPYEDIFDTSDPITIPAIKNLEVTDITEQRINSVKVGYVEQQIDGVNGKYEPNNAYVFAAPFDLDTPKQLLLVCPYPSQPYAIEMLRINMDGKNTTDNSSDNTVYLFNTEPDFISFSAAVFIDTDGVKGPYLAITDAVHANDFKKGMKVTVSGTTSNNQTFTVKSVELGTGGYNVYVEEAVITEADASANFSLEQYKLKRDTYDNALSDIGIPDPVGIFNIEYLSPKEILLRHIKLINSLLYGFDGELLTFQTTERNPLLKRVRGSSVIEEAANEVIGTDIIFKPFILTLDAAEPAELVESLDADINRSMEFGDSCGGFILRAAIQPDTKEAQSYRLLCDPNTDILNIHTNAYK